MGIYYVENSEVFHLCSDEMSYVFKVEKGYLLHIYWGKKLRFMDLSHHLHYSGRCLSAVQAPADDSFTLDTAQQEFPGFGHTDLRSPIYQVQLENGTTITDLTYKSHTIKKGKPSLEGLPGIYTESGNEAETLEIELYDQVSGLSAVLSYTVFEKMNVIIRSVRYLNNSSADIKLLRALSMSIDFAGRDFEMLQLSGAWIRERAVYKRPLVPGMQLIDSKRGASGPFHNPFIALLRENADEDHGEVFGFNFVYSGNFVAGAEVDPYDTTRVFMGINPFDFSWLLKPGENFQTPEVVMVYSDEGMGKMSRTYHELYRTRLCRGVYRDKIRPVLINSWEAVVFDFNEEKILNIARAAGKVGIELFVLDDGWFGKRNDDRSSLGDWWVNKEKLPNGLESVVKKINDMGLEFGIWFEPEMVSPDSDLYRAHPDWCIHVPNYSRSEGRNQLILDLSRQDVCDEVIKMLSDILSSMPIRYVKWDMNRHMTETGSAALPPERQRETAHRYILGLYRIMETLVQRFPNILFESCSSGGGRFDPGMLYYMPQTWASDNTDAADRVKIQYGTSLVYPAISMGAHVSDVPKEKRCTPLETRGYVAMSGNFGYELDLTRHDEEELEAVKRQIEYGKEIRPIVQFGDFFRLISPFERNNGAWMFVSKDKSEALAFYFRFMNEPNGAVKRLKLKGLDESRNYRVEGVSVPKDILSGDELMYAGIWIPELRGDYESIMIRLRAVE